MSLRALRKLQEKKKLESPDLSLDENESKKNSDEDKNDADRDGSLLCVKACNRFDFLVDDSHSESEAKEDDDLPEVGPEYINRRTSVGHSSVSDALLNASGARKKRKKRKKKSCGGRCPASSEDQMDHDLDEVEKSVKEVNEILGEAKYLGSQARDTEERVGKSLLCVEHKHLNPQNEMKRIFGARVVQAQESNKRRNQRSSTSGARSGRGTWIVQKQPIWGQHAKPGLSMVLVESTPSYNLFKFQHNAAYQQAQFKFLEAAESLNPDNILNLLHMEPFHVDTLLQVAEILRLADDSAMSAQLIERVIFVMESAAHPLFNVTTGNSRLNFKQQENRGFFIAIFRHILNVGLKGCYRTALELCKLLLSLSPDDDPMAVSLTLDFYALRAQEYAWLVALYDLYEPTKNLSMLPNFSFSVPLALFHLSQSCDESSSSSSKDRSDKAKNYQVNTLGSKEDIKKRADEMLQRAVIMFPAVIRPLLERCNVQPDINIDSHPYFGEKTRTSMTKGLSQIINLYVGRNYHVWKEPDVINWLEENFKICLERVEHKDPLAAESEEKRRLRYQGTPTAIYRHILIAEIKDATATLPPLLANTPVMSYDPLPPHDSICDYSRPKPPSRPTSSSSSILASFFRGLLPNYDPNAPDAEQRREDGDGVGGPDDLEGAGAELRASVNTLLEAMRNLFSNIHLAENHPGADEDADRSEEEEEDEEAEEDEVRGGAAGGGRRPRRWD